MTSTLNGDRNVHFSTEAQLGDNNQLWQAIQFAVNGGTGPTVGLQMGRQGAIVASRNDMDLSRFVTEVDPAGTVQGIYDKLLPILSAWKADYNFVGSYYINVGDNTPAGEQTVWSTSLPYYRQLIQMGNEIGSHSLTHLGALTRLRIRISSPPARAPARLTTSSASPATSSRPISPPACLATSWRARLFPVPPNISPPPARSFSITNICQGDMPRLVPDIRARLATLLPNSMTLGRSISLPTCRSTSP